QCSPPPNISSVVIDNPTDHQHVSGADRGVSRPRSYLMLVDCCVAGGEYRTAYALFLIDMRDADQICFWWPTNCRDGEVKNPPSEGFPGWEAGLSRARRLKSRSVRC